MDWLTLGGSLLLGLAGGGLATVGLNFLVFKHQVGKDRWQELLDDYLKEIDSAEKRGDTEKVNRLRIEYEGQLAARRAQPVFEAIAPRSISPEESQ